MDNNPSSDDLIRQAREAFTSSSPDPIVPTEHPVSDDPVVEHRTVVDRIFEERERSRVEDIPSRRGPDPTYPAQRVATPTPESGQGGSKAWRTFGIVTLIAVGLLWALLILGLVDDPTDAGSTLGGGAVLTGIPIGIGVYSLRRGARS